MGRKNGEDITYNLDMERALLACCMGEDWQDNISLCLSSNITEESFYLNTHKTIWEAIVGMFNGGNPIDEVLLVDRLRATGKLEAVGGIAGLDSICGVIDIPVHINRYVQRVRDLEVARRIVTVSKKHIDLVMEGASDIKDVVDRVENEIFAISRDRISGNTVPIGDSVKSAIDLIDRMNAGCEVEGITSGFLELDRMLFGFKPGEMIVIAARPSMGKTSLAMNIAENIVFPTKIGQPPIGVLFFSLEMGVEQLTFRLLCGRSGINTMRLRDGFVMKSAMDNAHRTAEEVKNSPLYVNDCSSMTIGEIRAHSRRTCSRGQIGLIIIDYLQLVHGDNKIPREQQIAEISRGIKGIARELNLPVIVLSQLNRDSEKENRPPRLSDIRESGAIEQDADVVLMLAKSEKAANDYGDIVPRDLIIAKNRNGPVGRVTLGFIRNFTRFENFSLD